MAMPKFDKQVNHKYRYHVILVSVIILTCYYMFHFKSKEEDPFAVPFCEKDGTCHEKPDKPSPRTVYSAFSKEQYEKWWSFNTLLNVTCEEYNQKRKQNNDNKQALVLLGDSITEAWRGTGYGQERHRADGVPQVLSDKFAKDFDPIVLGISGDQTQHLLYRIQNGQLPSKDEESAIYVVMIGTNNLGSGELPGPVAKGILAVADCILNNTKGQLLLFEVLPRGDGSKSLPKLCPPRCSSSGKPFKSFIPAVEKVNEDINEGVEDLKQTYSDRIGMIQCNSNFIDGESEVKEIIMPDLLHPNAAGHSFLADCILGYLNKN